MFLQSWKVPLGSLHASIFLLTTFLLLLRSCCAGPLQVVGSSQPVVAMMGDDITLPCLLKPSVDAVAMALEWTRSDLEPKVVHRRRDSQELLVTQNPSYVGRTSMSRERLKLGDASLKLSNVKMSDEGKYRCFFPIEGKDSFIQLLVGSASSPVIRLSGIDTSSGAVMLECESAGWYPEPEVLWLDAEGHLVSAGPTETLRGPDGLYTVSSSVTVEHKHNNTFTCKLQQNKTNQTRETQIQVPDELFMTSSSSLVPVTIVLACLLCIFAVAFIVSVWKQRQTKLKCNEHHGGEAEHQEEKNHITTVGNNMELQSLVKGERDKVHVSDMRKTVEKQIKNLHRELEKKRGEEKKVLQEVNDLMINKQDLTNQIHRLNVLIQQDDAELNKNKQQMDTTDLLITNELKLQQVRVNLQKRREEHEFLLKNKKTLMQTTENMVTSVMEKKEEVEILMKHLNQKLQEAERRRETFQMKRWSAGERGNKVKN